jgi:predicted negative regulator of RcsB-dependent stress response
MPCEAQAGRERAGRSVIFDHLGDALAKNDLSENALATWEKSLQLDPNSDGIKNKIKDMKTNLHRLKSERSKASQ